MAYDEKPPVTAEIDRHTLIERATAVAAHYQAIVDEEKAAKEIRDAAEREAGVLRLMTVFGIFKRSREKAEAIYDREDRRWGLGRNWPTSAQYRLSRAKSLLRVANDETLTSIRIPENDVYLLNIE